MQLVKPGDGYRDLKPLPCKRWSCELCAPRRRRQLIAMAASGLPNKILTLTVRTSVGSSPTERRRLLHDAWKRLAKRVLRQFAIAPDRRWSLSIKTRQARAEAILRGITRRTPQRGCDALHYFAFVEKTKAGEPHLHILLRCPYVPQDWLAEQMQEIIGSPVCWIEEIHSTRKAISYVTKYVTKAPAQFGNLKRYWISRNYMVNKGESDSGPVFDMAGVRVKRERWTETQASIALRSEPWRTLDDGWIRVFEHSAATEHWGLHGSALDTT